MGAAPGAAERAERGPSAARGAAPASPAGSTRAAARSRGARSPRPASRASLVVYLYLHLGVLTILLAGAGAWSDLLQVAASRTFLIFDEVVLLFGLLFHGLNGLRRRRRQRDATSARCCGARWRSAPSRSRTRSSTSWEVP